MDIFHRLGYEIHGIERLNEGHIGKENGDDYINEDDRPSLVPSKESNIELQENSIKKKNQFMQEIASLLEANERVDPKSHCPLDVMRVELKVKDNYKNEDRTRRFFSQTERAEVDATIAKWLENGIIAEAPKGNPYNNNLVLAARKNLEGEVLKLRLCLDPRTLNQQLVDIDNYPIPIINEVLERAAGHKYFITIERTKRNCLASSTPARSSTISYGVGNSPCTQIIGLRAISMCRKSYLRF
jgi:hypothetical protein